MKTYLIAGLLGASALAGAVYAQQAPTAAAAGKPQIGAFGFDEAGMDRSIAPGDAV